MGCECYVCVLLLLVEAYCYVGTDELSLVDLKYGSDPYFAEMIRDLAEWKPQLQFKTEERLCGCDRDIRRGNMACDTT